MRINPKKSKSTRNKYHKNDVPLYAPPQNAAPMALTSV